MNALPADPHNLAEMKALEQYFHDMARYGFDVACVTCRAIPHDEIVGDLTSSYTRFASEARKRNRPACIQIHPAMSCGDTISIFEAQYHSDNTPDRWGDKGFYASFASTKWKEYLKDLCRLFVEDYGFNWVLFEEPTCRVDIPGTKDKFYRAFLRYHPELDYPEKRAETAEYLAVQALKHQVVAAFLREMTDYAKKIGAEMVGATPVGFVPSGDGTPDGTFGPSCGVGDLAGLPGVDFLVVRMQPGSVRDGKWDDLRNSAILCYPEILSHCDGKPVIAIADPSAGLQEADPATAAACPNGLLTEWQEQKQFRVEDQGGLLCTVNRLLSRLGGPTASVAFVFSGAGGWHVAPYTYEKSWQFYWAIAKRMLIVEKCPMLTFSAEALSSQLALNPQVRVLVLEEHFPLSEEQVNQVTTWWTSDQGRAIVIVGGGCGFSADVHKAGERPMAEAFPGLLQRIGIRLQNPPSIRPDERVLLKTRGNTSGSEEQIQEVDADVVANVRRIFGSRARVLKTDRSDGPVIIRWGERRTAAYFCGLGSSSDTAPVISQVIREAMRTVGCPSVPVATDGGLVLWNKTRNGYIVIANCEGTAASATVRPDPLVLWDVTEERLVRGQALRVDLPPYGVRVFRCTAKRSKFYDVSDAVYVSSITAGAGRADVDLYLSPNTRFIVCCSPRRVLVDGSPVQAAALECGEHSKVSLPDVASGRHMVTLRW